jgi:hypothetical protein
MLEFHIVYLYHLDIMYRGRGQFKVQKGVMLVLGRYQILDCAVLKLFRLKQSNILSCSVEWYFCDH